MGKTHAGQIGAFSNQLVKPGIIAAEHSRALARVAERRIAADYDGEGVTESKAAEAIDDADAFVAAVAELLDKDPTEPGRA